MQHEKGHFLSLSFQFPANFGIFCLFVSAFSLIIVLIGVLFKVNGVDENGGSDDVGLLSWSGIRREGAFLELMN